MDYLKPQSVCLRGDTFGEFCSYSGASAVGFCALDTLQIHTFLPSFGDYMVEEMFLCNTSAIKDWSFFLSQILPLMNKTTRLVNMDEGEDVTTTMVTALQPDSVMSASNPPLNSNHTSGMEHLFQYSYSESDLLHTDYRTPARGSIPLPKAILYLLMAALVVVVVAYAIVGHLVKDVVNEFVGM